MVSKHSILVKEVGLLGGMTNYEAKIKRKKERK